MRLLGVSGIRGVDSRRFVLIALPRETPPALPLSTGKGDGPLIRLADRKADGSGRASSSEGAARAGVRDEREPNEGGAEGGWEEGRMGVEGTAKEDRGTVGSVGSDVIPATNAARSCKLQKKRDKKSSNTQPLSLLQNNDVSRSRALSFPPMQQKGNAPMSKGREKFKCVTEQVTRAR